MTEVFYYLSHQDVSHFILSLGITTVTISLVALIYMGLEPFLSKIYTEKTRYYLWLPILLAFFIPFLPQLEKAPIKIPISQLRPVVFNSDIKAIEEKIKKNTGFTEETLKEIEGLPSFVANELKEEKNTLPLYEQVEKFVETEKIPNTTFVKTKENTLTTWFKSVYSSWWNILFTLWIIGAFITLSVYLVNHISFVLLAKRWKEKVKDTNVLTILEEIKYQKGISKKIHVYTCPIVDSPMMMGFICPTILLPENSIDSEELFFVFNHELTHFKRKDLWMKLLV